MRNPKSSLENLLTQKVDKDYPLFVMDLSASLALAQKYQKAIKPKECYDNIVRLLLDTDIMALYSELRVAYGGVESISGLFIRHAFFLDMDSGKVVDPTLSKTRAGEVRRYLIAVDFSFDEFLESMAKFESADPEINLDVRKEMEHLLSWCFQHGMALVG